MKTETVVRLLEGAFSLVQLGVEYSVVVEEVRRRVDANDDLDDVARSLRDERLASELKARQEIERAKAADAARTAG